VTDDRRYDLYRHQVQGTDATSRPFYFRARGADWELWLGPAGADADYPTWADHKELVAEGPDDELTPDDIDELLTLHLGSGWTLAARPSPPTATARSDTNPMCPAQPTLLVSSRGPLCPTPSMTAFYYRP
jgi:hypothetical protein